MHFGPIASGEILHDAPTSDPLTWIREHYEDAVAIELEAAGFAKAGQLNAVPGAVIRAISDSADGTKAQTDGDDWQNRAIRNVAVFAITLTDRGPATCRLARRRLRSPAPAPQRPGGGLSRTASRR